MAAYIRDGNYREVEETKKRIRLKDPLPNAMGPLGHLLLQSRELTLAMRYEPSAKV